MDVAHKGGLVAELVLLSDVAASTLVDRRLRRFFSVWSAFWLFANVAFRVDWIKGCKED